MSVSKNLQGIISKQKDILAELEAEAGVILRSDLHIENESLKKEVEQLQSTLTGHSEKLKTVSFHNTELKNALYEQIYSEKLQIINGSLKKSDIYFKGTATGELNRLAQLEKDLLGKIHLLEEELKKYRIEASEELYEKLKALSAQVTETVTEARAKIANETGAFSKHAYDQFEKLKEEQITEDMIISIGKKNNLEAFVGGNLINKLGILFVILGIIAVSRYTFFRLPDTFKGIVMFAISGGLLMLGEFLNRKKASVFSLGLTSGGVAGLYASLSISYFGLNILSMYPAIFLCILVTTGAFVLSQRYNSQTIAAFALVGGYIPIVSISETITLTYSAMIYFVVLNGLALTIAFYKKWNITMFIGYFLNLLGTLYIVFNMLNTFRYDRPFGIHELATIFYVLFAFAIYTLIPVLSNYRKKQPFSKSDIVVLGLNTLFSALIMYMVFYFFHLSVFNGLLAILFAVIYMSLGRFVETHFVKEKHTLALFYLTGLTFVILVIPFQFGKEWLSLGWLVQGVCLTAYGILTNEKNFKRAGFLISGLCLGSFLYFDLYGSIDTLFAYKYLAITLGSIIILGAFAYKKSLAGAFENGYKYMTLVNVWFYSLYIINLLDEFLWGKLAYSAYNADYLVRALAITVTFLLAFVFPRIPVIADKGMKIISVCLSLFGLLSLMWISVFDYIVRYDFTADIPVPLSVTVIAGAILIILCGLAVMAMRNVLMFFVLHTGLQVEWLPFGISSYFLVILSQNLIWQYGLSFTSIVISIVYVIAALGWIVYGFIKRFSFMRRFGLGLSVLAVAKLFLVDLPYLTQGYKIVSYFAFGITLLGISFVYQYFSKRLMPKGDTDSHVEQND